LVDKAVNFFRENFPSDSKKQMDSNFFTAKIADYNPNGRGYFTVALYDGEVVGTAVLKGQVVLKVGQQANACPVRIA
jgi:hypothetical protein